MNFLQARFNMVEQQIRTWEVLDQHLLSLVGALPRERFVPAAYERLAYADTEVPLVDGQRMLAPKLVARALQSLSVRRADLVLEVGTGSGYGTALLAEMSRHVISVELSAQLHATARQVLTDQGVENITLCQGDGSAGWPQEGPYDVIVFNGSVAEAGRLPREQLNAGGRMFVIAGDVPAMEALLITRAPNGEFVQESLFETVVPRLQGAERVQEFVL